MKGLVVGQWYRVQTLRGEQTLLYWGVTDTGRLWLPPMTGLEPVGSTSYVETAFDVEATKV